LLGGSDNKLLRQLTESYKDKSGINVHSLAQSIINEPMSQEDASFKDIQKLNWAWIYRAKSGNWTQFECLTCMILESRWQLHQNEKQEKFLME